MFVTGANTRRGRSCRKAAIRELKKETDPEATECTYLFKYSAGEFMRMWGEVTLKLCIKRSC
jgi:hypothetical protein